jgi:hypothetical protein
VLVVEGWLRSLSVRPTTQAEMGSGGRGVSVRVGSSVDVEVVVGEGGKTSASGLQPSRMIIASTRPMHVLGRVNARNRGIDIISNIHDIGDELEGTYNIVRAGQAWP